MQSKAWLGWGLCVVAWGLVTPVFAAKSSHSIDCAHVDNAVTRIICGDPLLRKLDESMALAYTAALHRHPKHAAALRQDQRDWLAGRDDQAWRFLSQPEIAGDTARKLRALYKTRIEFLRHAFDMSKVHSAFLKHMYHWLMAGGVPGDDILAAAGAHRADESMFDNVSALLTHLPAPADAGLRKILQNAFGESLPASVSLAWLPTAGFGGVYNVEGTAECASWIFIARDGKRMHDVPAPKLNGGCWNHVLELVQWRHRVIAVNVGDGLVKPIVDLQLHSWQGTHWSTEERLRLRFARKVALKSVTCAPQVDCARARQIALRIAVRYDRRPLPQTLATMVAKLSAADNARFRYLKGVIDCTRYGTQLPQFGRKRTWVGMTGFGSEATAFPVRLQGKLAVGCISHSHLGWRRGGVWLIGMWTVKDGMPVPLAGVVAGGEGKFLVAAPMPPRVVQR